MIVDLIHGGSLFNVLRLARLLTKGIAAWAANTIVIRGNSFAYCDAMPLPFRAICLVFVTTTMLSGCASVSHFRDCDACPEMTIVQLAKSDTAPGSETTLAVGRREVTRAEFDAFMRTSEYKVGVNCRTYEDNAWAERSSRSYRDPGLVQPDEDAAVCVTWFDARAYVAWLNGQLGVSGYRLPTADEWRALLAGGGPQPSPQRADRNGLYGMMSAAAEWSATCARVATHPVETCVLRTRLGRAWADIQGVREANATEEAAPTRRDSMTGFRVVKDLQ